MNISFKEDLFPAIMKYCIAILVTSAGLIIGSYIVFIWYLLLLLFLFLKRTDLILQVLILWTFIWGGAFHYGFLGKDYQDLIVRNFNIFVFISFIISFFLNKRNKIQIIETNFFYILFYIGLISAIFNAINIFDIFKSYFSTYRWLIFGLIVLLMKTQKKQYKSIFSLIIAIMIINSIFGLFQQTLLPIQSTPDGYTPSEADVASGFLGITNSQHLTSLCFCFASFYFLQYLIFNKKFNLIISSLLLLQPFIAESKFSLILGISLLVFVLLLKRVFFKNVFINSKYYLNIVTISVIIFIGLIFYNSVKIYLNKDYSLFRITNEYYLNNENKFADYAKVQGYYDSLTKIAPSGEAGILLGIGPYQFFNQLNSNYVTYINKNGFTNEERIKVSSVDFRVTDITQLISELGLLGLILFLFFFYKIGTLLYKQIVVTNSIETKILKIFAFQFLLMSLINSFYYVGIFNPMYFIPFWLLLRYSFIIEEMDGEG